MADETRSAARVLRWLRSVWATLDVLTDRGLRAELAAGERRSLDATAEYERLHPIPPREDGCVYPECIGYDANQPCPCAADGHGTTLPGARA